MKNDKKELEIQVSTEKDGLASTEIEKSIFESAQQLKDISSKADILDCAVATSSGILCGMLDILLAREFNLQIGRDIADTQL